MASLFKPTYTKKDPKTGKAVRRRSKKWYGKYRDAAGVVRRVPLCTDKVAAQAMLNELVVRALRQQAGVSDPFEQHLKRPLTDHLADFRRHLEAKGNTRSYVRMTVNRVRAIFDGCEFKYIGDIVALDVASWLAEQRESDEFGISTSNAYLAAAKSFCNWLLQDRRTNVNALVHLSRLNADLDVRVERRAASPEEIGLVLKAARKGEPFRDLSGPDRALLYLVAAETGFRAGELASLTPASFDLESGVLPSQ